MYENAPQDMMTRPMAMEITTTMATITRTFKYMDKAMVTRTVTTITVTKTNPWKRCKKPSVYQVFTFFTLISGLHIVCAPRSTLILSSFCAIKMAPRQDPAKPTVKSAPTKAKTMRTRAMNRPTSSQGPKPSLAQRAIVVDSPDNKTLVKLEMT